MRNLLIGFACGMVIALGVVYLWSRGSSSGPYGGDLVPLGEGAQGEVLANDETGEAVALIWDASLRHSHPIPDDPIVIGRGERTVTLRPHPRSDDPSGHCSRFYGQADWLKGGRSDHEWLEWNGHGMHHRFAGQGCWNSGPERRSLWHDLHHDGASHGHGHHH